MTLLDLRERAGKSREDVARELHTHAWILAQCESGARSLSIMQALTLARLYCCTAETILEAQQNSIRTARSVARIQRRAEL